MRTGMVALALGLLTPVFCPALPPLWLIAVMPVLALMVLPFRTHPLGFFLIGLAWACLSAQLALDDRLPAALDGETRWLEGHAADRAKGNPQKTNPGKQTH